MGGSGGPSPPDAGEVFKNFVKKKAMKKFQSFKIFKKISRFFQNFIKFYRILGENLDKNLENLEICILVGSGG